MVQPAGDLRAQRAVALAGAFTAEAVEIAEGRLTGRDREGGEAVAQVLQPEGAALGDPQGVGERPRIAVEQLGHLGGRLQAELGVRPQQRPGPVETGPVLDAGQHVLERAVGRAGVEHGVGGHQPHPQPLGQLG